MAPPDVSPRSGDIDGETRKYAATLARRHFDGTVTADAMLQHFGDSADPLIQLLLQAVCQQPRRGFFGMTERTWRRTFWEPTTAIIEELEKGERGRVPVERLYPRISRWVVAGWVLFTVWFGASAAERAVELWRGVDDARLWWAKLIAAVMGAFAAWIGTAMLRGIWWMDRRRRESQADQSPPDPLN